MDAPSQPLIGDGEDLPDPDLAAVRQPQEITESQEKSMTHKELLRHYLKTTAVQTQKQTELLSSIRAWVMFFGILTIISLVFWTIVILGRGF